MKEVVLDNGLTIYLNQDKNKHRTTANIYIKAGGLDNNYLVNGEKHFVPYGVAHFLEHYLIEQSRYGNALQMFNKDYVDTNGVTSSHKTYYYISTVHDFMDNFKKLLDIVNNPIFEAKRVDDVKKPVISEIDKQNDNKYLEFNMCYYESLLKAPYFNKVLGEVDTIENMDIKYLEDFYYSFYQPKNQIIVITGNFEDNIIDFIKDYYENNKRDYDDVEIILEEEIDKVIKDNVEFKKNLNTEFVRIAYKVNYSNLSPYEKNKLDYYFSYIYDNNFGTETPFFKDLIKSKLSLYSVDFEFNPMVSKDHIIFGFTVYTDKYDEAIKKIQDKLNNLDFNEKDFNNWKNNAIIKNINSSEDINWITNNFINNLLLYDLPQADDIEFIKELTLDECKKCFNKLDLSNILIIKNLGVDENENI